MGDGVMRVMSGWRRRRPSGVKINSDRPVRCRDRSFTVLWSGPAATAKKDGAKNSILVEFVDLPNLFAIEVDRDQDLNAHVIIWYVQFLLNATRDVKMSHDLTHRICLQLASFSSIPVIS